MTHHKYRRLFDDLWMTDFRWRICDLRKFFRKKALLRKVFRNKNFCDRGSAMADLRWRICDGGLTENLRKNSVTFFLAEDLPKVFRRYWIYGSAMAVLRSRS